MSTEPAPEASEQTSSEVPDIKEQWTPDALLDQVAFLTLVEFIQVVLIGVIISPFEILVARLLLKEVDALADFKQTLA